MVSGKFLKILAVSYLFRVGKVVMLKHQVLFNDFCRVMFNRLRETVIFSSESFISDLFYDFVLYNLISRFFFRRQVLDNGTLVFLPFSAVQYRQDIHATVYRCRAHNAHGTIVSRDMRTQAG